MKYRDIPEGGMYYSSPFTYVWLNNREYVLNLSGDLEETDELGDFDFRFEVLQVVQKQLL